MEQKKDPGFPCCLMKERERESGFYIELDFGTVWCENQWKKKKKRGSLQGVDDKKWSGKAQNENLASKINFSLFFLFFPDQAPNFCKK